GRCADVADLHTQPSARHFALFAQLLVDDLCLVGGDGEADALETAGAAGDGRVDADDLPADVDQRPAGVAGVDGGVDLDEVLVAPLAEDADIVAVEGADDAV